MTTPAKAPGGAGEGRPKCRSCPHPEHRGLCQRRSGGTAWACMCHHDAPTPAASEPGGAGEAYADCVAVRNAEHFVALGVEMGKRAAAKEAHPTPAASPGAGSLMGRLLAYVGPFVDALDDVTAEIRGGREKAARAAAHEIAAWLRDPPSEVLSRLVGVVHPNDAVRVGRAWADAIDEEVGRG